MKNKLLLLALPVFAILMLSGCAIHTSIARILNDPYHYQNRLVSVRGTVTNAVNAIVAGGYQVDDGTGRITVLANGGSPRRGSNVTVNGRVSSPLSILGNSMGTTIRERDRHVHRY